MGTFLIDCDALCEKEGTIHISHDGWDLFEFWSSFRNLIWLIIQSNLISILFKMNMDWAQVTYLADRLIILVVKDVFYMSPNENVNLNYVNETNSYTVIIYFSDFMIRESCSFNVLW